MMKRFPYWVTAEEYEQISAALRDDEAVLRTVEGRGLATELGVARPRFENSHFVQVMPIVLGKPKNSFPIRLSKPEHAALLSLPLDDGLKARLTNG
jgi:hypothetical protein